MSAATDQIRSRLNEVGGRVAQELSPNPSSDLRARGAALDAKTRVQLNPNPASVEMRDRLNVLDKRTARNLEQPRPGGGAQPRAPFTGPNVNSIPGTTGTTPGVQPGRGVPGHAAPGNAGNFQRVKGAVKSAGDVVRATGNGLSNVRNALPPVTPGNVLRTAGKLVPPVLGAVDASSEEGRRTQALDMGSDLGGQDIDESSAAHTALTATAGYGTLGLTDALSRAGSAFINPTLNPVTGEAPGVGDRLGGSVQALVNPNELRRNRSRIAFNEEGLPRDGVVATPGALPADQIPENGFVRSAVDSTADFFESAFSGDGEAGPSAGGGDGGQIDNITPGGTTRNAGNLPVLFDENNPVPAAPANSIRTNTGAVIPAGDGSDVNTIPSENFSRISSGLSQQVSDARSAAANRGDFSALQTQEERDAANTRNDRKIDSAINDARQTEIASLSRQMNTPQVRGNQSRRQGILDQIRGLQQETVNRGFNETANTASSNRNRVVDPLSSPTVIAEQLRQRGLEGRRGDVKPVNLRKGFEFAESDVPGEEGNFNATTKDGAVIQLSPIQMNAFSRAFQANQSSGNVPEGQDFAEWVLNLQAGAGQS